jgi:spore coat polysaccharide biosynthesis protein SpsF
MRVLLIARMGSTRLPGKHLIELQNGKTAIETLIDELLLEFELKDILLCITDSKEDDVLEKYVRNKYEKIKIYRGHKSNVLKRIRDCINQEEIEDFIRINADNVLTSSMLIRAFINIHKILGLDYTCNTQSRSLPKGISIQIIRKVIFLEYYELVKNNIKAQENVFLDMRSYVNKFANISIECSKEINKKNLALDTSEDLKSINQYIHSAKGNIYYEN